VLSAHEALAAEQVDPAMAVWHTPLVCAFILQHRSHFQPRLADGQYRFLQFFVDRGIDAVNALARRRTARNRGSARAMGLGELHAYEPIAVNGFPEAFTVGTHHLREPGGGFVAHGHAAYGQRLRRVAVATIEGWQRLD
jgi:hypothetical protein